MAEGGFSLSELLLVVTVVGLLASISVPHYSCSLEKARVAEALAGIVKARDAVESFRIDHERYPAGLEEVFGERPLPPWLLYCNAETGDRNRGHGNDCDLSDEHNPSGKPGPHAIQVLGYRLWTSKGLAPGCQQVDYVHLTGGFGAPQIVRIGDKAPKAPKPPKSKA